VNELLLNFANSLGLEDLCILHIGIDSSLLGVKGVNDLCTFL